MKSDKRKSSAMIAFPLLTNFNFNNVWPQRLFSARSLPFWKWWLKLPQVRYVRIQLSESTVEWSFNCGCCNSRSIYTIRLSLVAGPIQIVLGNFLATFGISSNFGQLFLKLAHFQQPSGLFEPRYRIFEVLNTSSLVIWLLWWKKILRNIVVPFKSVLLQNGRG